MRSQEDFEARLKRGSEFAPSLIGLERDAAVQAVRAQGYQPKVVPTSVEGVTADLDSRRIRLFVDENGLVVQASAG